MREYGMGGAMIKICWLTLLISVAAARVVLGGVAHAQQASALVLEKSGVTNPDVQPYTEIPVGMTISLSRGAKLVFQHYHSCQTVTVVGGEIQFGSEIYTITGEKRKNESRTPCPRTVPLKFGDDTGGIMMRGSSTFALSSQPAFVLVGRRAGDFSSVQISKGNTVLLKGSLEGRRFKWPTDVDPIAAGTGYELALIPKIVGQNPVVKKFRVVVPKATLGARGLLLIRVD